MVVLAGIGGAFFAFNGHHSLTTSKPQHINLVALGDSLTEGVGDEKKQGGYVSQIKSKLESKQNVKVSTANYGVAGNRSDQIEKRLKTQPKFQKTLKNADVIVMTVGGNDLFQRLQQEMFVSSTTTVKKDMSTALDTYQDKLTSLMTEIRKVNPKAPLFLYSIYNPVYVYFANVSLISQSVADYNEAAKKTAQADGHAYFVDINHDLSDGQYNTKAKRAKLVKQNKNVNGQGLNLARYNDVMSEQHKNSNIYISNDDHFHPNHKGYGIMTNHLYKVMMAHRDQWER
ncbi:lipolytic protein G-D-S-L family protein [Secundilactobacillus oryzae JCM 18671]|uniref:Lipolytic protein G-D-S-L family protein n=1 Tax=Secundilactobacillus oryzae JCM 18671 TaxID=1291743 RepID=A0A081BH87_9LACO|nr:lipolytic protein G-D-S-L family protein [Secundilactobacillus oryzae JCM 18671]